MTEPDEGNEEYQGRTGIVVRELASDLIGRRFRVAFEGDDFQPLFYSREFVPQKPITHAPETVEVVKYLPAPQSAVNAAVASELERLAKRYQYKGRNAKQ